MNCLDYYEVFEYKDYDMGFMRIDNGLFSIEKIENIIKLNNSQQCRIVIYYPGITHTINFESTKECNEEFERLEKLLCK